MNEVPTPRKMQPDIEAILGLSKKKASTIFERWQSQIIGGGIAAALFLLYVLWSAGGSANKMQYVTAPATKGNLTVIVTATGSVQPTNKVDVSSELSGTIRKVLADYNDNVKVGQRLAELDTDKLTASVESSRAKLAATKARIMDAEATVVEKKLDYERKRGLVAKKISSPHDLEVALAAYDRALAARESAKAESASAAADLRLSETNLAKTCICSPIKGVILKRNVEPGQTVASSLQAPVLFTIAEDLSKMEIQVDVDEADVGKVKAAQKATFAVDAYPDKKFDAEIRELRYGSEIVQGVVTYKAVLTTNNSELLLRPGMTATAEITVMNVSDAVSVPNAALRYAPPTSDSSSDNRSFLQKILPGRPRLRPASKQVSNGPERTIWLLVDGEPKQLAVRVGPTDGRRTQIVTGHIQSGQAVIVDTKAGK